MLPTDKLLPARAAASYLLKATAAYSFYNAAVWLNDCRILRDEANKLCSTQATTAIAALKVRSYSTEATLSSRTRAYDPGNTRIVRVLPHLSLHFGDVLGSSEWYVYALVRPHLPPEVTITERADGTIQYTETIRGNEYGWSFDLPWEHFPRDPNPNPHYTYERGE